MMTITSEAGRRLARAKDQLDQAEAENDPRRVVIAGYDFHKAARAVASELMDSGFHLMDGDD